VNSASEANELALRLARAYTRAPDLIVMAGAYHGHTTTLIDISPYKADGPGGQGCLEWVHQVPLVDLYRGEFRYTDPDAAAGYAQHVSTTIKSLTERGRQLCGFICESLPSVGGQLVYPDGYLARVYAAVRAAGGLCIADEVQTGFGRIGDHFWGFEQQGVQPDIVVLGKPMGNGHPLGAVITTARIAATFANGMEFFSTFGGNTVSCAAGREVLRIVQEEQIQQHCKSTGDYLRRMLHEVALKHPLVGDVRGMGLFLGVEMVEDKDSRKPDAGAARYVANRLREQGILIGTDGIFDNVLKIRPPAPFNRQDALRLAETLGTVLDDTTLQR
ncbi:MAG: aminotransferase class III-fold pyridoxal phosphate-dependent enzyme, partial [Gammaproteobacteria bacterium]|nr:aminotransferase class III-fold pyridoxal phosphate-dependent enzyme [Gammaproteobacteria bacterium]